MSISASVVELLFFTLRFLKDMGRCVPTSKCGVALRPCCTAEVADTYTCKKDSCSCCCRGSAPDTMRCLILSKLVAAVVDAFAAAMATWVLIFPAMYVWRDGWFAESGSTVVPFDKPPKQNEYTTLIFFDAVSTLYDDVGDFSSLDDDQLNPCSPSWKLGSWSSEQLESEHGCFAKDVVFGMALMEIVILVVRWLIEGILSSGWMDHFCCKHCAIDKKKWGKICRSKVEILLHSAVAVVQLLIVVAIFTTIVVVVKKEAPNEDLHWHAANPGDVAEGFPFWCCCYRDPREADSYTTNNHCSAGSDWWNASKAGDWCNGETFNQNHWITAYDEEGEEWSAVVAAMCAKPGGVPVDFWDGVTYLPVAWAQTIYTLLVAIVLAFCSPCFACCVCRVNERCFVADDSCMQRCCGPGR